MQPIRLVVVFGGQSAEHAVSCTTASHVLAAADPARYSIEAIGITRGGEVVRADAAMAMQLGAQSVFVGSGIFKSADPAPRAKAIVEATTNFMDADILAKVSRNLGQPMTGIGMDDQIKFAERGW